MAARHPLLATEAAKKPGPSSSATRSGKNKKKGRAGRPLPPRAAQQAAFLRNQNMRVVKDRSRKPGNWFLEHLAQGDSFIEPRFFSLKPAF